MGELIEVSVGEKIRKYRKAKNLSQKQLAEMTGLATITIQGYEAGKYQPKADSLERLAVALECRPQDLRQTTIFRPTGALQALERIHREMQPSADEREPIDSYVHDLGEFLYYNPEHKVLFDSSMEVKKEDVEFVRQMIDRINNSK